MPSQCGDGAAQSWRGWGDAGREEALSTWGVTAARHVAIFSPNPAIFTPLKLDEDGFLSH
jgi:hypothetical protein